MAKNIRRYFSFILIVSLLCISLCGCKKKEKSQEQITVTISIECNSILTNYQDLNESKKQFVPEDGWILKETEIKVDKDATVFDALKKACLDNHIAIESSKSAGYDSVYIEGINQLYEFDCGPTSGWMYSVNDIFPNYGCSAYKLEAGDNIKWQYTTTLGEFKIKED